MIVEYHRPTTLEEALRLLGRDQPKTIPLAGGSGINRAGREAIALVDLQSLGLDALHAKGNFLELGAALTLQNLRNAAETASEFELPQAMIQAIELEASYNLRQVASVAGTLVAADGRSPFCTVMMALDAQLSLLPGSEKVSLGNLLPVRSERMQGRLISAITIPRNIRLAYEYVARTPADRPVVCAALSVWPSGRTRLALGGSGSAPLLAFDGADAVGLDIAAESAFSQAGDEWASAEYRLEIAGVLARRCLHAVSQPDKI